MFFSMLFVVLYVYLCCVLFCLPKLLIFRRDGNTYQWATYQEDFLFFVFFFVCFCIFLCVSLFFVCVF